ncbi:MAG: chitobiase/beta-hexosaminidase C-terminal domain-containing protein, partial [Spirochaetales bacterium]|nr:chitobiase/beta-hexosaminidase C-terminal domain-containing protein [Spirochaetales bacterium]
LFENMSAAGNKTVKAKAYADNMTMSEEFSAKYYFNPGKAASPSFSKAAGTYTKDITVELTNNESSGTLQYSFDNSTWTTYTSPISIEGHNKNDITKTIYAKVTGVNSKTDSDAVSSAYTISWPKLAKPTISPEAGKYNTTQLFTLASSLSSAKIYYTTNGATPTSASTEYTAPIQFNTPNTYTVKAYSAADGYKDSDIAVYEGFVIAEAEQSGGVEFTTAKALYNDGNSWINDENDANLSAGVTGFYGTNFIAGKTYEMSFTSTLSAVVTIYKNDEKNVVSGTQTVGKVIFTIPAGSLTTDKFYFFFNVTEAKDNVQISITESGTTITPTKVEISPKGNQSMILGGEPITFSVSYTPTNANTDKEVTWSVSNSSVLSLSGSTVTAKAAGTATVTATLKKNNSINDSETVTVIGTTTTTTTTTTVAPVTNTALGEKHPSSGPLSPVNQSSWGSTAYTLGANVSSGNTAFALYSKNATKVLLEIYDAAYGEDAAYDYWMTKNTSSNQWQATLKGDLTGKYYAFRVWGPNWTYNSSWTRGNSSAGFSKDYDTSGNRFNPNKVVFDPYAREISHDKSNPTALGAENGGIYGTGSESYASSAGTVIRRNFDTGKYAPKAVVINDDTSYGSKPNIPAKDAIIYEAHARGLTKHPSSANLST